MGVLVEENRLEYGSDSSTRTHTIEAAKRKFDAEFGLTHILEVGNAHAVVRLECFADCAAELLSAGYFTQWMLQEHEYVLPKRIREVERALTEQLKTEENRAVCSSEEAAALQEKIMALSALMAANMSEGSVQLPEVVEKKVLALRDERREFESRIAVLENRALMAEARVKELEGEVPRRRRWFERACWNTSRANPALLSG